MRLGELNSRISGAAYIRLLAVPAMLLVGLVPAHAGILEMTYSGTFATALGVIHAGDTFSGEITWDSTPGVNACPGSAPRFAFCLPLITDILNLPAGDGLSIPGATVMFQAVPEVNTGILDFSTGVPQINVVSSVDGNLYSFFIAPGTGGVSENFGAPELATGYTASGPTAAPEPGSLSMAAIALLLAAIRRREKRKAFR